MRLGFTGEDPTLVNAQCWQPHREAPSTTFPLWGTPVTGCDHRAGSYKAAPGQCAANREEWREGRDVPAGKCVSPRLELIAHRHSPALFTVRDLHSLELLFMQDTGTKQVQATKGWGSVPAISFARLL